MQAPDGEEIDRPCCDSHRHPQRDDRPADPQPTDTLDRPLHLPGGSSRTQLVAGIVEQEQESVTAPLQQPRAPLVRLVEQCAEHAVHGVAQQLGADLAAAREPLGELGEARDVDECQRSVDRAMGS